MHMSSVTASLIYNSDFVRLKKGERKEKKKSLITLFLIIHADGIIPLIILSLSGEASFKFNSGARDNHLA